VCISSLPHTEFLVLESAFLSTRAFGLLYTLSYVKCMAGFSSLEVLV